jgi:AcrR family transcriptional regulator
LPKVLTPEDIAVFRERLCDVAEEKFAAHGADGVTLRELADALGVSPMTPYRYFADKDAILAAVRARAFNRFAEAMEVAETKRTVRRSAFTGVLYVDWAMANPAAYRLMFDTQQPTAGEHPELVAAMARARSTMTTVWKQLQADNTFKGDIEQAGHLMWAAQHGVVMLALSGLLKPSQDARKLVRRMIEAIARDLGMGAG